MEPRETAGPRLPIPRTSFIGRAAELDQIRNLLATGAVVTLTGPAGSGKTRLALEAARRSRADFDQPWWVDLAPLGSGDLVAGAVATAIGLRGRAGVDLFGDIVSTIGDQRRLVILDNCEHLVEACASLCEALVTHCYGLTVLATSRTPLRIAAENVLPVPPLAIEDEALQLFVDRARSSNAGFVLGPANESVIGEICRRLDGIPLAIELAAAWAAVMSPSELLPLLDRRFEVLKRGSRSASERQRTLRSAIDWSYELLPPDERTLFRRLCVFAGSFTIQAAERVCSDQTLPSASILENLANLCAASMVVAGAPVAGMTRYRILESIRAYGLERLADAGEQEAFQDRHLGYFTGVAEAAFMERMSGGPRSAIELLEPDRDNVRAAIDWGLERDPESALGLSAALVEDLRHSLFTFSELRPRLQALLPRTSHNTARHAWALLAFGYTAFTAAIDEEAVQAFSESIHLFQRLGDRCGEAWGRIALGNAYWAIGDLPASTRELRLSEEIHKQLGNRLGRNRASLRAAIAGAFDPALQPAVRQELESAIQESRELGDRFGAGMAHQWVGLIDLTAGDKALARSHFLEAIPLLENDSVVSVSLFGLAGCCLDTDPERSLRLIGAGEALQPRRGLPKPPVLAEVIEEYQPQATARVGEERAASLYAQGFAMSRDDAIALALSPEEPRRSAGRRGEGPGALTLREREIAGLVSKGLTNQQIADSLFLSVRTVETHVDHILRKLGFHNRTRLASWVREEDAKDT
jgi:predicted ATPase/DNA-binding CsgD family transcriptional regulator